MNEIDKLNDNHAYIIKHALEIWRRCLENGYMLYQQKQKLKHGEWGKWVKNNLIFTQQHALRYMKIFKYRKEISNKYTFLQIEHHVQFDCVKLVDN